MIVMLKIIKFVVFPSFSVGSCISVFSRCAGVCFSSAPGLVPGYSWCSESQQCLPHGIKCRVLWGVGCGKSSYFCWRGNVCLPKSIPCNGNCLSLLNTSLLTMLRTLHGELQEGGAVLV